MVAVAIVAPSSADREALTVAARAASAVPAQTSAARDAAPTDLRWLRPDEAGDLSDLVDRIGVRVVIFDSLDTFLHVQWEHRQDWADWTARGVRVEIAGSDAAMAPFALRAGTIWRRWSGQRRRRQAVVAAVLSALVIVLAFVANLVL